MCPVMERLPTYRMRRDVHGQIKKDGLKKRVGIPLWRGRKIKKQVQREMKECECKGIMTNYNEFWRPGTNIN